MKNSSLLAGAGQSSDRARATWKRALQGETVIWALPHQFLLDWSSPVSDIPRIFKLLEQSDSKAVRIPFLISGVKGGGKTTFLKVASLLGRRVLDFDVFAAAYALRSLGITDGTVGENYAKVTDADREALRTDILQTFLRYSENVDFISGNVTLRLPTVYLIPDYARYRKFLFRRDHDPNIKRGHVGNEILSNFKFIKENNSRIKELVQSIVRPVYFDVFLHSYEFSDWEDLLARIDDAKGLIRNSPRYKSSDSPKVSISK